MQSLRAAAGIYSEVQSVPNLFPRGGFMGIDSRSREGKLVMRRPVGAVPAEVSFGDRK
jgi:hypothetical protein